MSTRVLLLLLLGLLWNGSHAVEWPKNNGNEVEAKNYKWMIALLKGDEFLCNGALVKLDTVVTKWAECGEFADTAVAGAQNGDGIKDSGVDGVQRSKISGKKKLDCMEHDIVKLSVSFEKTGNVEPIALRFSNKKLDSSDQTVKWTGSKLPITTWGYAGENKARLLSLIEGSLTTTTCPADAHTASSYQICMLPTGKTAGAKFCGDDAGAPLVLTSYKNDKKKDKNKFSYLAALALNEKKNQTRDTCTTNAHAFIDVTKYYCWIVKGEAFSCDWSFSQIECKGSLGQPRPFWILILAFIPFLYGGLSNIRLDKPILLLLLYTLAFLYINVQIPGASAMKSDVIIDVKPEDYKLYPYVVVLRDQDKGFVCNGFLINRTWVITHKNCMEKAVSVVAGAKDGKDLFDTKSPESDESPINKAQTVSISCDDQNLVQMQLSKELRSVKTIAPPKYTYQDKFKPQQKGFIVGWSRDASCAPPDPKGEYKLKKMKVRVSTAGCKSVINEKYKMCMTGDGEVQLGGDDLGSPFMFGEGRKMFLAGMVGPSKECKESLEFINVAKYTCWIREKAYVTCSSEPKAGCNGSDTKPLKFFTLILVIIVASFLKQ